MEYEEIQQELENVRDKARDNELEIQRLVSCYLYSSAADKRVIWAVLNKYAPLLTAESLN